MALTAYTRFRFLWGAVDLETDSEQPAYNSANTEEGPAGAADLRRCVMRWNRDLMGDDVIQTSFVIVNYTGGDVDGTWTSGDYSAVEGHLDTFWGAIKSYMPSEVVLAEYRWYREGPGAVPPEVTTRFVARAVAGTGGEQMPGQIRTVVSLRTALRKQWGRIYLPGLSDTYNSNGRITGAAVDAVAAAANTLESNLAGGDFEWLVWSPLKQRAYAVERLWVDNSYDTQRSGKQLPTYHKVYSA